MLTTLYIENIAVIEKTSIDFSQGLNVLTGETGAGKSIIKIQSTLLWDSVHQKNLCVPAQKQRL